MVSTREALDTLELDSFSEKHTVNRAYRAVSQRYLPNAITPPAAVPRYRRVQVAHKALSQAALPFGSADTDYHDTRHQNNQSLNNVALIDSGIGFTKAYNRTGFLAMISGKNTPWVHDLKAQKVQAHPQESLQVQLYTAEGDVEVEYYAQEDFQEEDLANFSDADDQEMLYHMWLEVQARREFSRTGLQLLKESYAWAFFGALLVFIAVLGWLNDSEAGRT